MTSEKVEKYKELTREMFRLRKKPGYKHEDECPILDKLDEVWYAMTEEELHEVKEWVQVAIAPNGELEKV